MGFNFRKSIKLAPGLRLNLGKNGVSASVGIPGSGLSYSAPITSTARSRETISSDSLGGVKKWYHIPLELFVLVYAQLLAAFLLATIVHVVLLLFNVKINYGEGDQVIHLTAAILFVGYKLYIGLKYWIRKDADILTSESIRKSDRRYKSGSRVIGYTKVKSGETLPLTKSEIIINRILGTINILFAIAVTLWYLGTYYQK